MMTNHHKFLLSSLAAIFATLSSNAAVTQPEDSWREDQTVLGVNKEIAHATYVPYTSVATLKADTDFFATPWVTSKSTLRKSLNGTWKFHYAATPKETPADFYKSGFNASAWDNIPVPSCWAMQGYDTPLYCNANYPFELNKAPKIVRRSDNDGYDENPVGSYITTFDVPADWNGKQLFLNFEGIYSAAYVWVNGQFVGYSQAANTNHEFDITSQARQGANTLAVQVFKWSDGSFFECQDMFRWGGIFRDVTLTAVPRAFIRDHYITSELSSTYTSGKLNVEFEVDNRATSAFSGSVEITLIAPDGKTTTATLPKTSVSVAAGKASKFTSSVELTNLLNWTSETPNLYTLIFSLKDSAGKETMAFATKYGFRHIETKKSMIYINGQKVFFKGVNRQDTHPLTGRTMDTESLLKDVLMFKQYNINTVRTSHCPHQEKMMAMYDHFGIYVMDEADLETHAANWKFVNDDKWTDAYVDREQRMVLRDRNHPSVIFWSLGNESRNGSNFAAAREAIRELDPRLVHYEGQQEFDNSDFTSKMYPYESDVIRMDNWSDTRPHFLCEYAHAMGQSLGNFADYWEYIENSRRTVGGCIWDWADQAIYHPQEIKNGTYKPGRFYTGYDFPGPHQGNFMSNGVVNPLREVSAKLIEVKKVHQWIKMSDFNAKTKSIKVSNTYDFIDLTGFSIIWSISKDGVEVENGTVDDFDCRNDRTKTLKLAYNTEVSDDAEYLLTVKFVTREASDWADARHVVAEEQFAINERPKLSEIDLSTLSASLQTRGNGPVTIVGDGFFYQFDASGNLIAMNFDGHDYIYNNQGLVFDSFRWIENDSPYSGTPPTNLSGYSVAAQGLFCSFSEGDATGAKAVHLTARFSNPSVASYTNHYTIYADGTLDVKTIYTNRINSIERLGQSIRLNPALENLEYFARGPLSNYSDRKTASFAGIYTSTVTDQHEHFIHPQSMSNHEELRYLKLTSPSDPAYGLLIEAEGPVAFSALHFDESDYFVSHDFQLQPRKEVVLHLDYQQKGIGNGSCGSTVWGQYLIPTGRELTNTLRFTPMRSKGAGYTVPTGQVGSYITSLTDSKNLSFAAKSAPSTAYTAIPQSALIAPGDVLSLDVTTNENANISAWIDFNQDFIFSDSEKVTCTNGKITHSVDKDTPEGCFRMRIVVEKTETPMPEGPIAEGSAYDLSINIAKSGSDNEATYDIPDGSMHAEGKAFVKAITSTGAAKNVAFEAEQKPETFHTVLPDAIEALAGSTFSVKFVANEAAKANSSGVRQDLRYNYAMVYADFENCGKFNHIATIGKHISGESKSGNYDEGVMDFTTQFSIPTGSKAKFGRIRVIYQNAWRPMNAMNAFITDVLEGVSYDIRVQIVTPQTDNDSFTTLPEITRDVPEGTMHPDGQAWVKEIYTVNADRNINVKFTSAPENFYTKLTDPVMIFPGHAFSLSLIANHATTPGESGLYQDLRFNTVSIFTDWLNAVDMTDPEVYGKRFEGASDKANFDEVMDILHEVEVPEDAIPGETVIRVIYQNAWKPFPAYNDKNIHEGLAIDIPVIVLGPDSYISEIGMQDSKPAATFDLQGRRVTGTLRPGIYIINGQKKIIR